MDQLSGTAVGRTCVARCASKKSGRDLAKASGLIALKVAMEVKDDGGDASEVASCSLGVKKTLEQAEIIASKARRMPQTSKRG